MGEPFPRPRPRGWPGTVALFGVPLQQAGGRRLRSLSLQHLEARPRTTHPPRAWIEADDQSQGREDSELEEEAEVEAAAAGYPTAFGMAAGGPYPSEWPHDHLDEEPDASASPPRPGLVHVDSHGGSHVGVDLRRYQAALAEARGTPLAYWLLAVRVSFRQEIARVSVSFACACAGAC